MARFRRLFACILAMVALATACIPAKSVERSAARAVVLSLAQCVRLAALGCQERMLQLDAEDNTSDAIELGERCETALAGAKVAIISASDAVDRWDSPEEGGHFACSVSTATGVLTGIMQASTGPRSAPALSQALEFARPFGNACAPLVPKDAGAQ